MTFPLVSVVVPLYNHAQFIRQCLDSIAEDSYPNKEIIIIDDGSRDSSADIVRQWKLDNSQIQEDRFTFINRENRGLTKTLNELVGRSRGEMIAVLASDDYLLPGGIAARVEYLEQHSDKLAVFADCLLVDYDANLIEKSGLSDLYDGNKQHLSNPSLISYEIVFNWCVPGPVFLARKAAYSIVGGYDENLAVEDWDFYLRLASRDLLGFIDYPVAAYRIRPEEVTRQIMLQPHIKFNEAMFQTVSNNLPHFSGLKKAYLFAEKLKYHGILERLHGRSSLMTFLSRKAGRVMVVVLRAVYSLWAQLIVPSSQQTTK